MASADFQPRLSFSSLSSSSSSSAFIPLHKTQLHPRMHPPLSSAPNPPKSTTSRHPHKHLLLIISLSLLPFSLYLFSLYGTLHVPSPSTFGLIIEIADSHSQIRVFKSLNEVSGTPFSGESSDFLRVEEGLSASESESDPGVVGRAVMKLMGFAKKKIPNSEWKDTRARVMITGEKDEVEHVLEECRLVLRASGFVFRDDWASVLRGQNEGLYNWVAINYALGHIGKKPQETTGVIVPGRSALQDAVWKLLHKQNSQEMRSCKFQLQGLVPKASVPEMEAIGHHFGEDDWDNVKKQHNVDDMYLARSCFSHAFMAILLHESLGIPLDDKRVGFAAGSTPIDWRLGAFIAQTIMEPLEGEVEDVETHIIGNESISYFVLFAILLIFILFVAFFVMKLRKPQFKTVYDLEKGCYIVIRVPR